MPPVRRQRSRLDQLSSGPNTKAAITMTDRQHIDNQYDAAQLAVRQHRDNGRCWRCDHAGCWWYDWARAYLAEYQRGQAIVS
ncbi:hypothetical protein ACWDV4_01475 [Micromonospora sp. NPDC003197]